MSDGGLITCLLEMAFAGNCGISVNIMSHEIMKHDRAGDVSLAFWPFSALHLHSHCDMLFGVEFLCSWFVIVVVSK